MNYALAQIKKENDVVTKVDQLNAIVQNSDDSNLMFKTFRVVNSHDYEGGGIALVAVEPVGFFCHIVPLARVCLALQLIEDKR